MIRVFLVVFCSLVAACVTTGDRESRPESSPTDAAQINYELGSTYLRQNKYKLARERLERAIEQDDSLPGPYTALAILYERTGDEAQAERYYRDAIRVSPKDANVQNSFAVFLCKRGEHDEGQRYFLKAAKNTSNRQSEVAMSNAGVCAMQKPDHIAAEQHFRDALKRNPNYGDPLLHLAELFYEVQSYLKARAFLERFLAKNPATAEALELAVRIEKALGNKNAADDYDRQLRKLRKDSRKSTR